MVEQMFEKAINNSPLWVLIVLGLCVAVKYIIAFLKHTVTGIKGTIMIEVDSGEKKTQHFDQRNVKEK